MASTSTTSPSRPVSVAPPPSLPTAAKPPAESSAAIDAPAVEKIGWTAGDIWRLLDTEGPQPITRIIKQIDAQRDTVLQALGWLAREDKIAIEDDGRSRIVKLK
jgi:hypothetical protein